MQTTRPALDISTAIPGTMMDVPLTITLDLPTRCQQPRGARGRLPARRRLVFPLHLRRLRQARRATRARARGTGRQAGRPGRELRLEHAPASRVVLRRSDDRRGAAHRQHPAVSGASVLGVRARRRQDSLRRRLARPGGGAGDGRRSDDADGVRRDGSDERRIARRARLRRTARRPAGDVRLARSRRAQAAILCYTSATTGDPKGVLFTHRSTVLHAFAAGLADGSGSRRRDVLPVVPMFHVNAWGVPYLAPMIGAKLVMPGSGSIRRA
jgi:hypothetical protein